MIEKLFDVQARDLELDALKTERGQTPQELIDAKAVQENLERRRRDKQASLDEVKKQVRTNELELESLQSRRKSASESALMATTAKEASQFQNQELQFATRLEELEGDTLPLMERVESLQADVEALENELAEIIPQVEQMTEQEEARVKTVDEKMTTLATERDKLTEGIDAVLLKQYEQVRRSKRGVGLALVNGTQCGGCNVRLPIHVVQKVKKGKGITRCPSCGRILFAKD